MGLFMMNLLSTMFMVAVFFVSHIALGAENKAVEGKAAESKIVEGKSAENKKANTKQKAEDTSTEPFEIVKGKALVHRIKLDDYLKNLEPDQIVEKMDSGG